MFTFFCLLHTLSAPLRSQFLALPILNQKNICLLHNGSTSSGQLKNRVYFFPNLKTAKIVQVVTLQIHTLNVWPRLTDHGSAEKRKSARVPTRSRSTTASFPRPSEAVALAAWARWTRPRHEAPSLGLAPTRCRQTTAALARREQARGRHRTARLHGP